MRAAGARNVALGTAVAACALSMPRRREGDPQGRAPVLLIAGAVLLAAGCDAGSARGYQPVQPIAYSHKVHAGQYGIPCLYCHYAAERGPHAGVPAASVCMNCHTQAKKDSPEVQKIVAAIESAKPIEWLRVNRFPAHTHFDHARHVAGAGIECQRCHGPIETMERVERATSLSMGFCLDCHRATAVERVATAGAGEAPSDDCGTCHY